MHIHLKLFEEGGGAILLKHLSYVQSPFQLLSSQEWGWPNTANKIGPLSSLNNHVSHSIIVICKFANVSSIILEVDGTSDTGSEAVERSDMEADLATGVEWDTCTTNNVTIVTNIYMWHKLTNDTWREECEDRDIVSRLGASLLALIRYSKWWDDGDNNDCDEDLGISYIS